MTHYIEFAVRVPKDEADLFISRFGKGNVKIFGYLLREEIVRCGDCIYYMQDPDPTGPGWPMMCERTGADMLEPYGFCAWAERKEGEE